MISFTFQLTSSYCHQQAVFFNSILHWKAEGKSKRTYSSCSCREDTSMWPMPVQNIGQRQSKGPHTKSAQKKGFLSATSVSVSIKLPTLGSTDLTWEIILKLLIQSNKFSHTFLASLIAEQVRWALNYPCWQFQYWAEGRCLVTCEHCVTGLPTM